VSDLRHSRASIPELDEWLAQHPFRGVSKAEEAIDEMQEWEATRRPCIKHSFGSLRHSRAHTREALQRHKARLLRTRTREGRYWPIELVTRQRDRKPCSCWCCSPDWGTLQRASDLRLRERDAADLEAT
jgi:hypothetical protein